MTQQECIVRVALKRAGIVVAVAVMVASTVAAEDCWVAQFDMNCGQYVQVNGNDCSYCAKFDERGHCLLFVQCPNQLKYTITPASVHLCMPAGAGGAACQNGTVNAMRQDYDCCPGDTCSVCEAGIPYSVQECNSQKVSGTCPS